MKLDEVLCEECDYEEVFIDGDENVYDGQNNHLGTTNEFELEEEYGQVDEASVRQWKRFGTDVRKRYRCTSGPKKGKLVAEPSKCATRKDPKKVRQGRKLMRTKKNTIARKSKISKRKQVSKMVTRMNKRLRGEKSGGTMTGGKDNK